MVLARYFIGDEEIDYRFDEEASINNAIEDLSMMYYGKTNDMPTAIWLSHDLYKKIVEQNVRYYTQLPLRGMEVVSFYTSAGIVEVKPIYDDVKLFIYAGSEEGFKTALETAKMDKFFEDIVLNEEE